MSLPNWLKDLQAQADAMPFGRMSVDIDRHRSKTAKVTYKDTSTLAYTDNETAVSDLEKLLNSMIIATFSGKLVFDITFKEGTITLIAVKNKKVNTYQE